MKCPECGADGANEEGTDELGNMYYECGECGHQFDETEVEE